VPRTRRKPTAGLIHHVINRGNDKRTLFFSAKDYQKFLRLMVRAAKRHPLPLLAFCLMPNHWHFVVWPEEEGQVASHLQWLTGMHARWFQSRHSRVGFGHVYQDRYRIFPVRDERHLLLLLKYVESNPLRAGLVKRAEDWRWSSLRIHLGHPSSVTLVPGPVLRPANWLDLVNEPPINCENT
jgi:putative transposase